ncbi:MAG TPA: glycosyltransferase [Nocardioides sp.]|uniref:glycosyltransferase n=1 Tax=Nocardioides sp. TaxID=35761 RepID=UPI002F40E0F9
MQEVEVGTVPLDRLAGILSPERAERMAASAARARDRLGDHVVWHVNATAHGGGVAEMLKVLLAYGRDAKIENRWLVLDGDPEFFDITKRVHNRIHGEAGDGGPLGDAEHHHYRRVLTDNLRELVSRVSAGDVVVLHDPQPAGLCHGLRDAGVHVVWRCHIGSDDSNDRSDEGWGFLRGYVEGADAFVFSRRVYAPSWVDGARLVVIPPSIDPFSNKNVELTASEVRSVLAGVGLVADEGPADSVRFKRRDGTDGWVRTHRESGGLVLDGPPPPHDARLVVQVSRWDRLKDMAGVMDGFAELVADGTHDGAHLLLAGPSVTGVTDDPEGAEVLEACRAQWRQLPDPIRDRVHLASIPMDDLDENAIIVNAVQRHAYAVVQKSLMEGFGLTVTEAMWKERPVVASRVGGIQDQIVDGRDGLLLDDPTDPQAFAATLGRLLVDPALADRLGAAGRERVLEEFLGDRHLEQYVDLFSRLVDQTPA